MSTVKKITDELKNQINEGCLGKSGDYFYNIRDLAKEKGISYVSAQRITAELRKCGLVTLLGNHQYITKGPVVANSELYKYLQKFKSEKKRIGMFINRMTNEFFASISQYVSNALSEKGYELVILTGNGSFEREKEALESFITMGVDAVISCAGFGDEISEVYKNYILPTVFVGRYPNKLENSTSVLVNNVNAGRQVASHLIENGCRSFVYVGDVRLQNEKDMRLEGFKKQLMIENKQFPDHNVVYMNQEKNKESRATFKEVYQTLEKPVGVFCYHDMLAVRVMGICDRYGIKIPQDVLLAGVDDLPLCEVVSPRLTSISYRFDMMADAVVEAVLALIKSPNEPLGHKYINQSLNVRKSTEPNKK